jgi:hypothetical protein
MAAEDHDDLRERAGDYVAELKQRAEGPAAGQRSRLIEADSATRKTYPMCEGLLDYFPTPWQRWRGCLSSGTPSIIRASQCTTPGGKSMDHDDCIVRHLIERGGFDRVIIDGIEHRIRHSGSLAWWALALLQEEIEREQGLPLPRAARVTA